MEKYRVGEWIILTEEGLEREKLVDILLEEISKETGRKIIKRNYEELKEPQQVLMTNEETEEEGFVLKTRFAEIGEMHLKEKYYRRAKESEMKAFQLRRMFKNKKQD